MANNFSSLRKSRGKGIQELSSKIDELNSGNNYTDERIWKPTLDKAGNYAGIIRFLPPSKNEDVPFVRRWNHGFKVGNKWFIENCPTSLGKPCPVCESNSELWNSGMDSDKNIARDRKRKLSYYANILVIRDPANPENEGKVFLFRFGIKIFEKIQAQIQPNDPEIDAPVDVFDFWDGANFKIRVSTNDGGYPDYSASTFDPPAELYAGDDKKKEEIWNQQYGLSEFIDESQFKSYEQLSTEFNALFNNRGNSNATTSVENTSEETPPWEPQKESSDTSSATQESEMNTDDEQEEDPLAKYEKLIN